MTSVDASLPASQIVTAFVTAEQGQLPAGFPACVDSKLAFTGADYADQAKYVYCLTESDVAEIDGALQHFKCQLPRLKAPSAIHRVLDADDPCAQPSS